MKDGRSTVLLDCGGSSLPAIRRATRIGEIDAIVITHLHGDHFGGLPYFVMAEHFLGRTRGLVLAGPPSLAARWKTAAGALYADFDWDRAAFPVEVVRLTREERDLAGTRVSALPVKHVAASEPHGVRLRIGGRLIAYSGDATWTEALPALADGADLFVCESTTYETPDPVHLAARDLVAHLGEIRAKRTIVTHLGPETLEHLGEIGLEVASDGMELTL